MPLPAHADVRTWGIESQRRKPRKGDIVIVPSGAWITGTAGNLPRNAARTYPVRVHMYSDYSGEVTWAGTGGYWHRTTEWYWAADVDGAE